jgi:hypothetical protein
MVESTRSPTQSPGYSLHRKAITATDTLPVTNREIGINMKGYLRAHVQVVPSGGANPTVQVLWWSASASKFVQEHTPITRAGVGADTPYEFTVDCRGRMMLVAITTLAAGTVDVNVSGSEHEAVT